MRIIRALTAAALCPILTAAAGQSDYWFTDELAPYRALVDAYRGGAAAEALDGVLALEPEAVHALIDRVRGPDRRPSGTDTAPGPNERLFRAAAMLHLDAADRRWSRGLQGDATDQIELGVRWIELVRRDPEPADSFRRRWYRAATLLTFERGGWRNGTTFVELALERVTDDVALLTTAAWLYEGYALSPVILDDTGDAQLDRIRQRKQSALLAAARRAGAAAALSAAAVEARLRLARLRLLQGEGESVRDLLDALGRREDLPVEQAYLARLLQSDLYRRADESDRAERVLRGAIALLPDGQAARIALGRLLDARGDRRGAAAVLAPVLAAPASRGLPDPWVDYRLGVGAGPGLLAALRLEVAE